MDDVDDEMQGQDEVIKALENVKRQHQKELVDQGHVHLYQLKALQGQLLDTLIAQVSDPDQNIDAEIKQEIMKSIKKSIDGGGPSSDESGKCRYQVPPINLMMPSSSITAPLSDSCQLHHSFTSQSNDQSLTPSTTAEPHEGNVPSGSIRYPLSPRSLNMVCPPIHIPRPSSSDDKWKDENKLILSENKNLKIKNEELTKEIERYIRANESLEDKLKKLQLQLQRYETAQDSQSKLNSSLHSRLTSTTNQLNEFEKTINNMKEQIQMQNKECENLKQENVEVNKMLQQSITEMEHLSHENMTLKDEIKYLNEQTFDMENELSQLKSINDRHQYNEVQYQSIIHHLEDDIKNLQHITTTNHEHSHYTHNISSSPTRILHHHSPISSVPPHDINTSTVSSSGKLQQPLTRKKWLETSEGGLVFGSPSYNQHNNSVSSGHRPTSSVDSTLEAVRTKRISSAYSPNARTDKRKSIEERVEERLKKIREAEKRLTELQHDKERLESFLQRAPSHKITAETKQKKRDAESKLDEVVKEIGLVRMTIRNSRKK